MILAGAEKVYLVVLIGFNDGIDFSSEDICQMLCLEVLRMEQYCWDERGGKDAPRKEHDHAMDEMRYFAMDLTRRQEEAFAATWVERTS